MTRVFRGVRPPAHDLRPPGDGERDWPPGPLGHLRMTEGYFWRGFWCSGILGFWDSCLACGIWDLVSGIWYVVILAALHQEHEPSCGP